MNISKHRLVGVPFKQSPNVSGFMTPTGVIMHYTAGHTAKSAIETLTSRTAKVSAHLVIDRDGSITQLVPFNRVAWHAGRSRLNGRTGCNQFTIGFEFVNPGFFQIKSGIIYDATGKHRMSESWLKKYDLSIRQGNKRVGSGEYIWPAYTEAQIDAGMAAFNAVCAAYDIEEVATHEEIDLRGWKTDPGPAFPMRFFEEALGKNNDRSDGETEAQGSALVTASRLNVRAGPGTDHSVVSVITNGSEVIVIRQAGTWSYIEYAPRQRGWVASTYLT